LKSKNDEIERLKGAQRSYNDNNKQNDTVNNMIRKLSLSMDSLIKKGNISPEKL
jgi:hypothetical protein